MPNPSTGAAFGGIAEVVILCQPMTYLTFRRAETADVPAIVALVNSAYRGESSRAGWTTEAELIEGVRTHDGEIAELIGSRRSMILLADDGVRVVGSVHLQVIAAAAFLGMFAVEPTGQARGVGKAMMHEAEARVVADWGVNKMLMDVISVRHELIAFYQRRGYRLTGTVAPFPVAKELWTPKAHNLQLARMEKLLRT